MVTRGSARERNEIVEVGLSEISMGGGGGGAHGVRSVLAEYLSYRSRFDGAFGDVTYSIVTSRSVLKRRENDEF